MQDCFGPLGGICAFLGAVGILSALLCLPIGLMQLTGDRKQDAPPALLVVGFIGGALVFLVLILGCINQFLLPVGCAGRW